MDSRVVYKPHNSVFIIIHRGFIAKGQQDGMGWVGIGRFGEDIIWILLLGHAHGVINYLHLNDYFVIF